MRHALRSSVNVSDGVFGRRVAVFGLTLLIFGKSGVITGLSISGCYEPFGLFNP